MPEEINGMIEVVRLYIKRPPPEEGSYSGSQTAYETDHETIIPRKFYLALGVSKDAEYAEVRKAYTKILLACHPDKTGKVQRSPGDATRMSNAIEAFEQIQRKFRRPKPSYASTGSLDRGSREEERLRREAADATDRIQGGNTGDGSVQLAIENVNIDDLMDFNYEEALAEDEARKCDHQQFMGFQGNMMLGETSVHEKPRREN